MNERTAFVADLSTMPDELMDRIQMRSLADAMQFMHDLEAQGCRAVPAGPRGRGPAVAEAMIRTYAWSRTRALHAILAMDAILDAQRGGPSREMLDHVESTLALLGPLDPHGHSCGMKVPMSRLQHLIDIGQARIVPKSDGTS